jgi:phage shock protein PspC (stress-responsive transcriptional regulator)
MNKTININLASTFFHIDEGAYNTLQSYLDKLKKRFHKTVGKEEILRDIEARIAELFHKIKSHPDHVISEEDVQYIISVLGQPEDFLLEDEEAPDSQSSEFSKKLFRDPDDKYIGGVLSGIGHYFGLDASWLRLLWIFLGLFSLGSLSIIYIVLWIVIPLAETTADKLRMKGEPINISTIEKKIKEEFEEVSSKIKNVDYQKTTNTIKKKSKNFFGFLEKLLGVLPKVVVKLLGILFILIGISSLLGITIGSIIFSFFGSIHWPFGLYFDFWGFNFFPNIYLLLALFLFVFLPFVFLTSLGIRMVNSKSSILGTVARLVLLGLWLGALILLIVFGAHEIRKNNVTATKTEQAKITIQPQDTLYIQLSGIEKREGSATWSFEQSKIIQDPFSKEWRTEKNLSLDIQNSIKKSPYLELKYSSNGQNKEQAQKNANTIQYDWIESEGFLKLNPYWEIGKQKLFRNQEVQLTLYLPDGQAFYLDENLKSILARSIPNDQSFSKSRLVNHYWEMGDQTINCLSCVDSKKQLQLNYQDASGNKKIHLNVDSQGITIKKK